MRRIALILATLVISVIALGYFFVVPRMTNHINERFITQNGEFKIRVTAYAENPGFVSGAYYVFESAPVGSDHWHRITVFRHDDPVPIPRNHVHFLSAKIGYVFMGWVYAITTDGGHRWSVWNALKDLPNWDPCNYRLIEDVNIHEDGTGTMTCNPIPQRRGEVPLLETSDFGKHWRVPASNKAMEPTASRRTIQLSKSSTRQFAATRALARGGSSCSR